MRTSRLGSSTISVIIQLANPVFILLAICLPIGALIYAGSFGSLSTLNYVHVMTGALWTGIDLFIGLILGPVLGKIEPKGRAAVFKYLTPKMTFLMPVLATVTITSGIQLAQRLGIGLPQQPLDCGSSRHCSYTYHPGIRYPPSQRDSCVPAVTIPDAGH